MLCFSSTILVAIVDGNTEENSKKIEMEKMLSATDCVINY